MKITKIEVQKKNKDRVSIFLEGTYAFSINMELVYNFNLKEDMDIDMDFISDIVKVEEQKKANNAALVLLSSGYKTEREVRNKLSKKGFDEEYILKSLDFVRSYNFVNDEKYTEMFVRDKILFNNVGKNKIKTKLFEKGIDKNTINETIDNLIDDEQQFDAALNLAKKKIKTIRDDDKRKVYQKLGNFLQYRGFTFDIIKKVLNELKMEEYED